MRAAVALLALLALAGCSQTNLAEILQAVGQSDRTWCVRHKLGTVYGTTTTDIMGTAAGAGTTVKCNEDGLTVTVTRPPEVVAPSVPAPLR